MKKNVAPSGIRTRNLLVTIVCPGFESRLGQHFFMSEKLQIFPTVQYINSLSFGLKSGLGGRIWGHDLDVFEVAEQLWIWNVDMTSEFEMENLVTVANLYN